MNKLNPFKNIGFTLIEVMIAIAIFSIAGLSLLSTSSTNINSTSAMEQQIMANWIAANQLVEVKLANQWPVQNKKGKVEFAGQEWFWQQKVIATTDDSMKAVEIEIKQNEANKKAISSFLTYVVKSK